MMPADFVCFPSPPAAIRRLNDAGLPVVVVTNQSGVGRGYFPESLVHTVNELMTQQLAAAGARIDAIYYCPHTSADDCSAESRRPECWNAPLASIDSILTRSFVVGDRYGDVELAQRTGPAASWSAPDMAKANWPGIRQVAVAT